MSNTGLIIEERSRDIGDFLVGRLIPFRKKRMVGPFIFIDHMGPAEVGPDRYMDVDQHPHIGLSTLTYLFDGEIMHRDSLGTEQLITKGSVNWMVAGKGVAHTERSSDRFRESGNSHSLHGYQIWAALPKELEDCEPEFHHIEAKNLPIWKDGSAEFKLVAGEAKVDGNTIASPVPVHSNLFMIELRSAQDYNLDISDMLQGEVGVTIVEGSVEACGTTIEKGNMMVSKVQDACKLTVKAGSLILIFGGHPFEEERHIYWNFVSSSKDKIEAAKQRWKDWDWPRVPNDDTYVALPK